MFCPKCEGEYRAGIFVCPTCEVSLTETLDRGAGKAAGARRRTYAGMFDLVGFVDEREARDARQRLRSGSIPSELVIRDAPAAPDGAPVDEYWIRVPMASAQPAAEILGLDAAVPEGACPSCGAPVEGEGDCPHCGHVLEAE
jgi:hypothetical protein